MKQTFYATGKVPTMEPQSAQMASPSRLPNPPARFVSSQTECGLCALPPEIRNIIYRFALVQDTVVAVTASGIVEPGLLSTCKIIRQETGGIFYGEGRFAIDMIDYSPEAIIFWTIKGAVAKFEFNLEGLGIQCRFNYGGRPQPNWSNLIKWMAQCHSAVEVRGFFKPSKMWNLYDGRRQKRTDMVIAGMFHIVDTLRSTPWKVVEEIMGEQRVVLGALDKRWML